MKEKLVRTGGFRLVPEQTTIVTMVTHYMELDLQNASLEAVMFHMVDLQNVSVSKSFSYHLIFYASIFNISYPKTCNNPPFTTAVDTYKKTFLTRKSSCVNARGIPPAAYQVLAMLGRGGVPHPQSGGYPVPGLGGYPVPGLVGVPHPRSRGEGVTHPSSIGDPISGWGTGVPQVCMGYLPPDLGWGTPPSLTWDGVPPWPDLGWGTPLARPWMGYPPARPGMGFPPPQCEQTDIPKYK